MKLAQYNKALASALVAFGSTVMATHQTGGEWGTALIYGLLSGLAAGAATYQIPNKLGGENVFDLAQRSNGQSGGR